MAKQGAKRRVEENKKRLTLLLRAIVIASVFHCVVRLGWFHATASFWSYIGAAGTVFVHVLAYSSLKSMAEATYDETGEIVDGGADLKLGGVAEYTSDIIYITILVQVLTLISAWFWLLYLVVPGFAIAMLWKNVLAPWIFAKAPAEVEETEVMRKKREKLEKKANRQKMVYSRR